MPFPSPGHSAPPAERPSAPAKSKILSATLKDDLWTQYPEAILFLKRHLSIRTEIKGIDRRDYYEIPPEALREAVANALIHRDYSMRGTSIIMEGVFFRPISRAKKHRNLEEPDLKFLSSVLLLFHHTRARLYEYERSIF